jgi:hypothetical protein
MFFIFRLKLPERTFLNVVCRGFESFKKFCLLLKSLTLRPLEAGLVIRINFNNLELVKFKNFQFNIDRWRLTVVGRREDANWLV